MSINWNIPRSSLFYSTRNIFTATFNNPVLGKYSFNVSGNENVQILELKKNSVYLIERMSAGGNIPEETYFSAQEVNPELILKRSISRERIYPRPIPILNYVDGAEIVAWVISNKKTDFLTATFTGLLRQTALLNGETSISISINLSIYEISNTQFYSRFSGREGIQIGEQVSGGDLPSCDCNQ